jgi:hypothetical protein
MIDPSKDGISHVNIYSGGKTTLGISLSNFAVAPIETDDGHFESIEGYWYWLGTDIPLREDLRGMSGKEAKLFGRSLKEKSAVEDLNFEQKIKAAILTKLVTYPEILWGLVDLKLPLAHYYNYGGRTIEPKGCGWLTEYLESFKGKRDIWDWHALGFWTVIPTNLQCKGNGAAVMGAGLAKQAADKYRSLPIQYGVHLVAGNGFVTYHNYRLLMVPTKIHWRGSSTLGMVESAVRALKVAKVEGKIVVPPLGCGLGGLDWAEVQPILMENLPTERFLVIPPKEGANA